MPFACLRKTLNPNQKNRKVPSITPRLFTACVGPALAAFCLLSLCPARTLFAQTTKVQDLTSAIQSVRNLLLQQTGFTYTEIDTMAVGANERYPHQLQVVDAAGDPSSCIIHWTVRDPTKTGRLDVTWTIDVRQMSNFYVNIDNPSADTSRGEVAEAYDKPVYILFMDGRGTFAKQHTVKYIGSKPQPPRDKDRNLAWMTLGDPEYGSRLGNAIQHVASLCGATLTPPPMVSVTGPAPAPTSATPPPVYSSPVSAQSDAGQPTSGANATLGQTLDFINATFQKMGAFNYPRSHDHAQTYLKYVGYFGPGGITHTVQIESQSVTLADADHLTYTVKATDEMKDNEWIPTNKKGEKCKPEKDGIYKICGTSNHVEENNTSKTRMDDTTSIPLDTADPRTISIEQNTQSVWNESLEEGVADTYKDEPVQSYTLYVAVPSETQKGRVTKLRLGVFFDKDTAEHVAKAYIHAIALRHKAEAPSLF